MLCKHFTIVVLFFFKRRICLVRYRDEIESVCGFTYFLCSDFNHFFFCYKSCFEFSNFIYKNLYTPTASVWYGRYFLGGDANNTKKIYWEREKRTIIIDHKSSKGISLSLTVHPVSKSQPYLVLLFDFSNFIKINQTFIRFFLLSIFSWQWGDNTATNQKKYSLFL